MTKRERIEAVYRRRAVDRVPFAPAIYEHKGALIGKTPSEICRNAEDLYRGLRCEMEIYDPDLLVIGIDVYNVEAEAMGCRVVYLDGTPHVPAIVEPLIHDAGDLDRIGLPDPETGGRMPVYLEVAGRLAAELGRDIVLRGAVTGPYSMAAALVGAERFLFATVEDPPFAARLMQFCARVAAGFGKAFLARGVEPILFDSRATPRLASPRVFRQLVKPIYRDYLLPELKAAGGRFLPLIIGGNTTAILDDLIETGATQLLCDPPSNLARYAERCRAAGLPFRANLDAALVSTGTADQIHREAVELLRRFGSQPGFLLGCGVVAYNAPPENVLAIRRAIEEAASLGLPGSGA